MNDLHIIILYFTAIFMVVVIAKIWSLPINRLLKIPRQGILSPCKSVAIIASVILMIIAAFASMVCAFWWIVISSISTS